MSSNRRGRPLLVVISGPSGSGKTTITKEVIARNANYWLSVSATTRSPRPGEVDGRDYLFLSREKFRKELAQGGFLEHSEHFGNLYGTPRKPVEEALAKGKVAVLEIDVNGARQATGFAKAPPNRHPPRTVGATAKSREAGRGRAKESLAGRIRTLLIFVNAPSDDELRRRILNRPGTQDDKVARERLSRARMEVEQRRFFDYEVINDDVAKAVEQVETRIRMEAGNRNG